MKKITVLGLAGLFATTIMACGGGGGGDDSSSPSVNAGTEEGTVYSGGTLIGATVCVDDNNDLGCDNAVTATTDATGGFKLAAKGKILVQGGYDQDSLKDSTNKPVATWEALSTTEKATQAKDYFNSYVGSLQAPSGSGAVTPVTTMVTQLVATGVTQATAETNIKQAMGIPATVSLTSLGALTDKSSMEATQSVGRMFRQATTTIASASGIDTATNNLGGATAASFKDMRMIFKEIAKNAAKGINDAPSTVYNFSDSSASATTSLTGFISSMIEKAATTLATDTSFTNKTALALTSPTAISAIAVDSIAIGVQKVATLIKNADFTNVASGSLAGLASAITKMQTAGVQNLITAQEKMDVVATQLFSDDTFKAMINSTSVGAAPSAAMLAQIKGVGTQMAGAQTAMATNNGNLANANASIMGAISGAFMKVNAVSSTAGFTAPANFVAPTATNITEKMVGFVGNIQQQMYGANITDAQKTTLTQNMTTGMNDKMISASASGDSTFGVFKDVTAAQIASALSNVGTALQNNTKFGTNFVTNNGANIMSTVNQQIGVAAVAKGTTADALFTANPKLLTDQAALNKGTAPTQADAVAAAKVPGFILVGNNVTVNGTTATVDANGAYSASYTPSTAVWGGVASISFAVKASGQPLGPTGMKSLPLAISVVPTSAADKRRATMVINQVDFAIVGTTLSASVPVGSKLSYNFTNAAGSNFTAEVANTKADIISVAGDVTSAAGATITLSGTNLVTPVVPTFSSKDSSLTSFTAAVGTSYTVTTVLGNGGGVHMMASAATPSIYAVKNVSTVTGDALVGTLTAK